MKKLSMLLSTAVMCLAWVGLSHADTNINRDGFYRAEGNVKAVYADFITILRDPEDTKSDESVSFRKGEFSIKVDSLTGVKNVDKLSELNEGDRVEVKYNHDPQNNNVASLITKLEDADYSDSTTIKKTTVTTVTTTNDVSTQP